MSIGFPLAPAETGLSSVIPSQFQVRFRTRRCSGTSSDTVPLFWIETINIADFLPTGLPAGIVGKGKFVAKSDALALMNVGSGTPTNVTALHALAVQMAKDFALWRSISHDITFNGTIASTPNGIMDLCEWTLLSDNISTRETTQQLNGEPEEFNHNDPANSGCTDGQSYVTKTPCTESYIPLWESDVRTPSPSSPIGAYRSRICLEDGRLTEYFNSEDILACGCSGGNPCLTSITVVVAVCNPSQAINISVVIKDQHGTVIGSTLTNFLGQALFINFPCDNTATYTITITKTGFTTISQTLPVVCCQSNSFMFNLLANPLPMITVNFHVASCESGETPHPACSDCLHTNSQPGISGVVVGVTVNGTFISCSTNANGDCTITFPVNSNGARYQVSASGGACVGPYVHNANDDIVDTCLTQTVGRCIILPIDPTCHCLCCQNPRPNNLFLTDSVYGAVNLTWSLCADGNFRYTGTKTAAFIGACGCAAAATDIIYFLDCPCITTSNTPIDTTYQFFVCYTQYKFIEVCGASFLQHCCPGPIDPLNVCSRTLQIPYCPTPIPGENGINFLTNFPFLTTTLQNTTEKCAVPLHIIFNGNPSVNCAAGGGGGGPCQWHGVAGPTPWPTGVTFTVTE